MSSPLLRKALAAGMALPVCRPRHVMQCWKTRPSSSAPHRQRFSIAAHVRLLSLSSTRWNLSRPDGDSLRPDAQEEAARQFGEQIPPEQGHVRSGPLMADPRWSWDPHTRHGCQA